MVDSQALHEAVVTTDTFLGKGDMDLENWCWMVVVADMVGQSQRQKANEKLAEVDFGYRWGCYATDVAFRSPMHRWVEFRRIKRVIFYFI